VNNELYINFTFTGYGYYTLTLYGTQKTVSGSYSVSYSKSITVSPTVKKSVGMSVSLGISAFLNSNQSYAVPVYTYYGNGTRMNLTDTGLAFLYATLYVMQGNIIIHAYAPTNYAAGVIDFHVSSMNPGQYTFYVSVSPVNISNSQVYASATQAESVTHIAPSPLQAFILGLQELGAALAQNLIITIIVTVIILALGYGIKYLIGRISRLLKRDKRDTQDVDNVLIANAGMILTETPIDSPLTLAARYGKLSDATQAAFSRAPDGQLKNYPATYMGKSTNLMELRFTIEKMDRKYKKLGNVKSWFEKTKKDVEGEKI
jgi:hypothetical protein